MISLCNTWESQKQLPMLHTDGWYTFTVHVVYLEILCNYLWKFHLRDMVLVVFAQASVRMQYLLAFDCHNPDNVWLQTWFMSDHRHLCSAEQDPRTTHLHFVSAASMTPAVQSPQLPQLKESLWSQQHCLGSKRTPLWVVVVSSDSWPVCRWSNQRRDPQGVERDAWLEVANTEEIKAAQSDI